MPAKYSHAKKKLNSGQHPRKASAKNNSNNSNSASNNNNYWGGIDNGKYANSFNSLLPFHGAGAHRNPNPHLDRTISQAMTAVSELERAIARIILLRYEHDIARLYSTRLHNVALVYLPRLMRDCTLATASPGWVAANADCDEIKDFFRSAIAMDLRQAGERVATKSVLWSYTALRHFALSNNVSICSKRGLHSLRLLPHFPALKAHLTELESTPTTAFCRPTYLTPLEESLELLEGDLTRRRNKSGPAWRDWKRKVRLGYERLTETLWKVAREFDVRGYGLVLRDKLLNKWCECGCSTDHLGEVCERTVREEEEENGIRSGKEREWDGRGSGVLGWQTDEEEDIWEIDLDFSGADPEECDGLDPEMTIGELMEWRYFRAEKAKELGNKHFRAQDYEAAIKQYSKAYDIEPELPHYQLNIAAAHLKLANWIAAEKACNLALQQHKSGKGYWRRAKARRMQGRTIEAVKDLRNVLKVQPGNVEALEELLAIMPSAASDFTTPQDTGEIENRKPRISPSDYASSSNPSGSSSSRDNYDSGQGSGSSSGGSSSSSRASSTASSSRNTDPRTNDIDRSNKVMSAKKHPKHLPFETTDEDSLKLRIYTAPLQVEMPVNLEPKDLWGLGSGAGKGDKGSNAKKGGTKGKAAADGGARKGKSVADQRERAKAKVQSILDMQVQIETYSYPTWERCEVKLAGR